MTIVEEILEEDKKRQEENTAKWQEITEKLNAIILKMLAIAVKDEEYAIEAANQHMTECIVACEKGNLSDVKFKAECVLIASKDIEQRLAAKALKELAEKEDKEGIAKMLKTGYGFDGNQIK